MREAPKTTLLVVGWVASTLLGLVWQGALLLVGTSAEPPPQPALWDAVSAIRDAIVDDVRSTDDGAN